ncbi:MAG: penicillin-binding protein 1A [Gammaproteobacteria bacterium]|nr:penicillin-binding protein 1A [Gammaproteobacteria bacterium]
MPKLPSIESLREVQLQVPLKIYTKDEKLLSEYGEKRRAPLDINQTPKTLINAVLAAEDDRFYEHYGVDPKGLLRAVAYLIRTGEKGPGGSTITMQVARNFFLSRERTYLRKLNEILLSFKIERELTKNEILELYLNKIYLGNRSYGFAAAAQVYYGKTLDEMTAAQIAMIAGLPKAPSAYNPIINPERALQRRNYVLSRMHELGSLADEEYQTALNTPDDSELHGLRVEVDAPYVAEMVRAELYDRLGEDAYTQGYKVYTTVDSRLQNAANNALRKSLLEYEERHGFRGPEANVDLSQISENDESAYRAVLSDYRSVNKLWPALVVNVEDKAVKVYQSRHGYIKIEWDGLKWARPWNGDGKDPGDEPSKATDFLKAGDIIRIVKTKESKGDEPDIWKLAQAPRVEGALVSLSAHDGSILALVGGFDFEKSKFNRVIQAERQPGSNIKPFNYSAALEKGYTAASLINDAPIVFDDPGLESTWRPENYSGKVYGPTRLRNALINSRNLVSIRLLRAIGIPYAIEYLQKFGFRRESLPRDLSLSLGSAAITPLELVTGYAVFANGGYKVEPYFIDRVETADGVVIMRANPLVVCDRCEPDADEGAPPAEQVLLTQTNLSGENLPGDNIIPENTALLVPVNEDPNDPALNVNGESQAISTIRQRTAKRIVPAQNIYIMNSILRDVIKLGTAKGALVLNRGDIAGKTGTTNDQQDAWFSGFNPDVVATAWVGFDEPQTLGNNEFGGRAALPMWIDYMEEALKGLPEPAIETPPGLVTVRIDPESGLLVGAGFPGAQFEIFRADTVPKSLDEEPAVIDLDSGETEPAKATENIPEQIF